MRIVITVKEARQKRGITQLELAEKSGVQQATLSNMEGNRRDSVHLDNLARIMEALGTRDIGEVLRVED